MVKPIFFLSRVIFSMYPAAGESGLPFSSDGVHSRACVSSPLDLCYAHVPPVLAVLRWAEEVCALTVNHHTLACWSAPSGLTRPCTFSNLQE